MFGRNELAVCYAIVIAFAPFNGELLAQGSASPALARIENGRVIVRQFHVPVSPLPGQERPGTPMVERSEHVLRFNLADIHAFTPDGKPAKSTAWQSVLQRETAILFAGYAIVGPEGTAATPDRLNLPASLAQTYRPDAIVLSGARSPVQQAPVKGGAPGFPKGPQPRFGQAWIGQEGSLHLREQQELKSHYYASFPAQPGAALAGRSHVHQTTSVTVTRVLPVADVHVWGLDGKPVQAATVPELQGKWTPAVISADGNAVDPFFLQLIRQGTLVLALPLPPPLPGANGPLRMPSS